MAKRERRAVITHRTKITFVFNYVQKMASQLLSVGKTKDARLFTEMMRWYYRVKDKQYRREVVFEPWMLTTDSLPNKTEIAFLNSIFANIPFLRPLSSKLLLFLLFFFGGLAYSVHAQNVIKYTLQNDRTLTPASSNMLFKNLETDKKYGLSTDVNGQLTTLIPDGTYERTIEGNDQYKYIDTIIINNIPDEYDSLTVIKTEPTQSTYYPGELGKLNLIKDITNCIDENPTKHYFRQWKITNLDSMITEIPMYYRRPNIPDTLKMPASLETAFDSALVKILNAAGGRLKLPERNYHLIPGTEWRWVQRIGMPTQAYGYTIRGAPWGGLVESGIIFMNSQDILLKPQVLVPVSLREIGREIGLENFVLDPAMVMAADFSSQNTDYHPGEKIAIQTKLTMRPNKKLIITDPIGVDPQDVVDMYYYRPIVGHNILLHPSAFHLANPNNNIVDQLQPIIFKWTKSANNTTGKYNLHIWGEGSMWGVGIDTTINNITDSTFAYSNPALPKNTTFNWTAYILTGDIETPASEINTFTTKNHAPTKPILVEPANGDTIKGVNATFKWNQSSDWDNDVLNYTLHIFNQTKDTTVYGLGDTLLTISNIKTLLGADKTYKWCVLANDENMSTSSDTSSFFTGSVTSIDLEFQMPTEYILSQNYPNPFNPSTNISFSLPERAHVTLNIYNQLGEKVAVLANGEKEPGSHTVGWNGANMPSGIYFYQLQTEKYSAVKKLLLMK